jgi:hypothetical protein
LYRLSTDHNWSTDGIDDLFGTFHLFQITRTVTPVLEPDAKAAAPFQDHVDQWGIHDAFVADQADGLGGNTVELSQIPA